MYLKPPSIEIKTDIAKINNTSRKFNLYKDYNYNEIKIGDENK